MEEKGRGGQSGGREGKGSGISFRFANIEAILFENPKSW